MSMQSTGIVQTQQLRFIPSITKKLQINIGIQIEWFKSKANGYC